jgi:putative flavoprotein involved in K+ transport
VTLLGHLDAARDGRLHFGDGLTRHLAHGDAALAEFDHRCDEAALAQGLDLPPAEEAAPPLPDPACVSAPLETLDLAREGIATVIWANGARPDFSWVDLPVFGDAPGPKRLPLHQRGVTAEPGLYFLGLPWLHQWKSAFLMGADEDAGYLAAHIAQVRGH